jgi:hypothetical protein
MTDCTEPRSPHVARCRDGEGQEGMRKVGTSMTDCTEPRSPHVARCRDGEGQEGMRKVGTAS